MIALCALTLVGCENMGLDYAGTGEEGRNRSPSDLVSAVHRAAPAARQPVIANGRRWVPAGEPITLDAAELRSVGSSAGQTVYARRWDDAPFDMLFIRTQADGTAPQQEGATEPSGAEPQSGAEGQQPADDTESPDVAGSPGTAGSRGTSAPSVASGEAEWQPLVAVIGEDGGPAAHGEPAEHGEPAAH